MEMKLAREAARRFPAVGEDFSLRPLSSGHIHGTWLVQTVAGERFILQSVNRDVVARPEAGMENLDALRSHLRSRAEHSVPLLEYLPDRDGSRLSGGWRLYRYVEHSLCLPQPQTPEDLYQAALVFGRFLRAFLAYPAALLKETVPRFHDTPDRFRLLREAAMTDPLSRLPAAGAELDFVFACEPRSSELMTALRRGALPLRVIHGDTHFSNVLLHEASREALCVIDLDTVMPGLAAWDFGDLVRSCGCEEAHGGVVFSPERYRILLRGFVDGCPELSREELASLPLGAWTMTLESGVRYLTDYLEGDRVFHAEDEEHNLRRARRQLALLASMEERWTEIG